MTHSFPTRRSADLRVGLPRLSAGREAGATVRFLLLTRLSRRKPAHAPVCEIVRLHLARVGASVRLRRVAGVPAVWRRDRGGARAGRRRRRLPLLRDRRPGRGPAGAGRAGPAAGRRSEERRVGKEGVSKFRSRWVAWHEKKKKSKKS